eukprot:scaffold3884_cov392-Prasinococcus_capsulatus_cf.AAC.20
MMTRSGLDNIWPGGGQARAWPRLGGGKGPAGPPGPAPPRGSSSPFPPCRRSDGRATDRPTPPSRWSPDDDDDDDEYAAGGTYVAAGASSHPWKSGEQRSSGVVRTTRLTPVGGAAGRHEQHAAETMRHRLLYKDWGTDCGAAAVSQRR